LKIIIRRKWWNCTRAKIRTNLESKNNIEKCQNDIYLRKLILILNIYYFPFAWWIKRRSERRKEVFEGFRRNEEMKSRDEWRKDVFNIQDLLSYLCNCILCGWWTMHELYCFCWDATKFIYSLISRSLQLWGAVKLYDIRYDYLYQCYLSYNYFIL